MSRLIEFVRLFLWIKNDFPKHLFPQVHLKLLKIAAKSSFREITGICILVRRQWKLILIDNTLHRMFFESFKAVAIIPRKSRWYWYCLNTIDWPLFYLETYIAVKTFSVIYFHWSELRIDCRTTSKTRPLYIYQFWPRNKFMRDHCKKE